MTEQEFNNQATAGNIQQLDPPVQTPAPPDSTPPTLDDYLPVLQTLRYPRQSVPAVPTFIPKTFADSIQFIDDGTTKRPGFFINGEWVDLAVLIPSLVPPPPTFDPFGQFLDIIHWHIADINSANNGFNLVKPSGTGSVLIQDGFLLLATAATTNGQDGLASRSPYKGLNTSGKKTSIEFIVQGMDNGSGSPGFPMTDCEIRLYFTTDSGTPSDTSKHVGFRLVGTTSLEILGTAADGTTESTLSLDIGTYLTGTQFTRLRLDYTPGTGCDFYINGVLKGTITTHLPGTADLGLNLTLKTKANTAKEVDLGRVLIQKQY